MPKWILLLFVLVIAATPRISSATTTQQESAEPSVKIFLDCANFFCDLDFFRRAVGFVDYVRDRQDADVHILGSRQSTGGGSEFSLEFIGLRGYAGVTDTLAYSSSSTDTENEQREGLANTVRFGLMRYVVGTPVASRIRIEFDQAPAQARTRRQSENDPWNFWVFRTSLNGSLNGESTQKSYRVNGSFTATRTTEEWKLRWRVNGNYNRSEFELSDETVFINSTRNYGFEGLLVRSVSDHWSLGVEHKATASTFLNQDIKVRFAPGIEYNFFPYEQSSRRQLTLLYNVGVDYVRYEEETLFDKMRETIPNHSLTTSLNLVQPWGSSNVSLTGAQFLNDLSKTRLSLFGSMNIRVVRGLQFNVFGSIARIRDQVNIAKAGATDEEILLRRTQLATSFSYFTNIGFSYTFGSIFNNIVNTRFEGGDGGFFFF